MSVTTIVGTYLETKRIRVQATRIRLANHSLYCVDFEELRATENFNLDQWNKPGLHINLSYFVMTGSQKSWLDWYKHKPAQAQTVIGYSFAFDRMFRLLQARKLWNYTSFL